MPIQPRRTDGFSDDGLSYSVASDFDKQIGQALANQEARLKDPRYIPGALVERPDAPDVLNRELIDPVLTAFGMPTAEERLSRHGRYHDRPESATPFALTKLPDGSIGAFDKRTGQFDVVNQASPEAAAQAAAIKLVPKNASQTADWFQKSPVMQNEESQALAELAQPEADAVDILGTRHPTLLKNPPYATRFGPTYRSAMEKRQRAAAAPTEAVNVDIAKLVKERNDLASSLTSDLPEGTQSAINDRIAQIDATMGPQAPQEGGDELVKVYNPKGKLVRIRRSDLGRVPGYRLP